MRRTANFFQHDPYAAAVIAPVYPTVQLAELISKITQLYQQQLIQIKSGAPPDISDQNLIDEINKKSMELFTPGVDYKRKAIYILLSTQLDKTIDQISTLICRANQGIQPRWFFQKAAILQAQIVLSNMLLNGMKIMPSPEESLSNAYKVKIKLEKAVNGVLRARDMLPVEKITLIGECLDYWHATNTLISKLELSLQEARPSLVAPSP
ncbi:MAG: hypothetical protein COY58_06235 [Gammaproteobacteria bacterium CG_4_10_14_0_8_um_filter_38_16]|nr:MAG: hypothetical protein COY58_06235 [Gammaproteobacteria bacterium CG_4_10_14_0_8_um_filter_38_16]PJA03603.1 MAG: hypothetical protein COX72_04180 [Gammaproteobacteria bacterium CG_4_10_14_0_2_um_filter_38_22]PJB10466.1 MAG: hypothetical protein CO120_04755 [Gammaproteobacteria bacterium CG_4_9_14_3_um_filter_38_9]